MASLPSSKHIGVALEIQSEYFDLPNTFDYEEFLPLMFDAGKKEAFALKINSKNACPWAVKGEFAIFVPSSAVQSGKIALIRFRNRYCIKKVSLEGEDVILSTPAKQLKVTQNDILIAGKLMGFYRRPY